MMPRQLFPLFFWLICTTLFTAEASGAVDPFKSQSVTTKDEFLPVEKAYQPEIQFAGDKLSLHWQIADGYYLYRHQFSFKTATGAEVAAQIPAGKGKDDEYFGHVEVYYHQLDIALTAPAPAQTFVLAVTAQGCADAGLCYPPTTWYWRIDPSAKTAAVITAPPPAAHLDEHSITPAFAPDSTSWLNILLFALLGGSILNLMPCVFPVLSLKVLGFATHKEEHQALHGISYTIGVVFSFLLVAAVLLILKATGQAVGWGFQLQQPWFVAGLAYLFFAMGLSLSGFWELGGSWMGLGNNLASRAGYGGSFFTGMLATLVASPCTAPFMAPALGFAVTQTAMKSLAIFAVLGFGMALPVLVLCFSPKLLAYIPKPGVWMDRFKQALAFPLYATAIWLSWVVGQQTGTSGMMAVLAGTLAIAFGLWLWRFGRTARAIAIISFVGALVIAGSPLLAEISSDASTEQASGKNWQRYSDKNLAQLRAEGKPVFLNVTADWCITCLTNEKVALGNQAVIDAFTQNGVTYLKADWTHYNAEITALLAKFGRNGVPLYVFFPAAADAQPVVLPQLLRPTIIVDIVNPKS
ncbi:MAG TPA: protein-disulfide reductase DsbD [Spongiibacteraceae bacterium]